MINKRLKAILSGVAGAVTLTGISEALKRFTPTQPRVDIIKAGMIKRVFKNLNLTVPGKRARFGISQAGNVLINSIYYTMVGLGKRPLINAPILGLGGGAGVLSLGGQLTGRKAFAAKELKAKAISLGLYISGGLAAAGINKLFKAEKKRSFAFLPFAK